MWSGERPCGTRRALGGGSGRLGSSGSSACASQVTRSLSMGKRHHAPGGGCSRARGRGRQSTDYVAGTLKRPNRTMAGSLVGLHDRPVRPARGSVTASTVAVTPSSSCPDEHPVHLGPGSATGSAARTGDAPWQPTPAARPPQSSPLPPSGRGGRPLARVAQDRVALGQGGQAAVPEDPWWAPPLSGAAEIRQLAEELQVRPTA